MRLGGCMNWLKFLKTPIRLLLAVIESLGGSLGAAAGALKFLAGSPLRSLESLGSLGVLAATGFLGALGFLVDLVAVLMTALVALTAALAALVESLAAQKKTGPRLILPPGAGLRDMLHVIYPPKTAERVFDQIIADMRLEWAEAMLHDQKWLAHWVRVRGLLTVLLTVLAHAVAALGSILKLVK